MLSGESRKKSAYRLNNTLITMGAALFLQIGVALSLLAGDWPALQRDMYHSGYDQTASLKLPFETNTVTIGAGVWGGASPVISNGAAYFGATGGELTALRFPAGELLWKVNIGAPVYIAPVVTGGKLVFGSAGGFLAAVNAETGEYLWSVETGNNISASPVVAGGKVIVYTNSGHIFAVDAETGVLSWKKEIPGCKNCYALNSPASDGLRVFGASGASIFALDIETGVTLWAKSTYGFYEARTPPTVSEGKLFIGTEQYLQALNPDTGASLWNAAVSGGIQANGALAAADGKVYLPSRDTNLYALSAADGAVLWKFKTGELVYSAPLIARDVLLIASNDHKLYALDKSSGGLLGTFDTQGRIASAMAFSDGNLAALSDAGVFEVFKSTNPAPALPSDLAVDYGGASTSSLAISWTDNSNNETAFILERSTDSAVFAETFLLPSNTANYLDVGTAYGRNYWYRVKAVGVYADSEYSGTAGKVTRAAAPAGAAFAAVYQSSVAAVWEANGNPAEVVYKAELSTSPVFGAPTIALVTLSGVPYVFSGLVPEATYYFRVKAENSAGVQTQYTAAVSTLTAGTIPEVPSALNAAYADLTSPGMLALSWADNSGNERGFELERSQNGTEYVQVAALGANTTVYTDIGLAAATRYWYRVKAYNLFGESEYSAVSDMHTRAAVPANTTFAAVYRSSLGVIWEANGNPEEVVYTAELSMAPAFGTPIIARVTISSSPYVFDNLVTETTYYFRMKAENGAGVQTSYAAVVSTITGIKPEAPAVLNAGYFDGSSFNTLVLSWTDNSDNEQGFRLERSQNGEDYVQIAALGRNVTAYTDTNLVAATQYWYRVKTYNLFGYSEYAESQYKYTRAAAPVNPSFTRVWNSSAAVTCEANGNPAAVVYTVELSTMQAFDQPAASALITINGMPYVFTGLTVEATYYFRVKAENSAGVQTPYTVSVSTMTGAKPGAPSGLLAVYFEETCFDRLVLNWTDNSNNELGFKLERSQNGVDYVQIAALDVNATSYTDTGLAALTTYWYRLRAYNVVGGSSYSNIADKYTRPVPPFSDIYAGLPEVSYASLSWGDYDNDGDLDLAITGYAGLVRISRIYRNNNGVFADINAGLSGLSNGSVSWGDYDNDGDLDLAVTGSAGGDVYSSKVYRNENGAFTDINAGLTGVAGPISWGDYDNDGDLDLALAGTGSSSAVISKVYRNNKGVFTDINAGLPGLSKVSLSWGDFDNDGDLDLALAGSDSSYARISRVYRNTNGVFADINAGLPGLNDSSLAWGDYDNDGDLDLVLAGLDPVLGRSSRIYRNTNGVFSDINSGLLGVDGGSLAWGDYDNDGDLDLALTGSTGSSIFASKIYSNDNGVFSDTGAGLSGGHSSSVAWGDYDKDGHLDLALTGTIGYYSGIFKIYRNNNGVINTMPASPSSGFDSSYSPANSSGDSILTLKWSAGSDNQTPHKGLHYEIVTSTVDMAANPGWHGPYVVSVPPGAGTGSSPNQTIGNYPHGFISADRQPGAILKGLLENTTYYWKVRAIDTGLARSEWSLQQNIYIEPIIPTPPSGVAVDFTDSTSTSKLKLSWLDNSYNETGFRLERSQNGMDYAQITELGADATTYTDTGLAASTTYWYRVNAYTEFVESAYSATASKATRAIPLFTDINAALPGVNMGSVAWGDYDNDGDVDLAITGGAGGSNPFSKIYRNDNGSFTDINAGLTGIFQASIAWGDYDNDMDLDLALTSDYGSKIYRNGNGTFQDINAGLSAGANGAWGDYDNDGDLDLALPGRIYRNDKGVFTDISAGLPRAEGGSVSWGDYDNDGDLDLALSGFLSSAGYIYVSRIYRNNNGAFADINAGLAGVTIGAITWGDYDNDGDLDLALAGLSSGSRISRIYRNNNGVFTNINAGLPGLAGASLAWGDYDKDGDLDLALTGSSAATGDLSKVYRNDNGAFTDINIELPGVVYGSIAWGDYDKDGDLDLALAGSGMSKIYRNENSRGIHAPTIPLAGFSSTHNPAIPPLHTLELKWGLGSDAETPAGGLQYEVKVATANMDENPVWRGPYVISVSSGAGTGSSSNQMIGTYSHGFVVNFQPGVTLKLSENATYYWKVRAIDTGLVKSEWSQQQQVYIAPIIPAPSGLAVDLAGSASALRVNWIDNSDNETGFKLERSINGADFYQVAALGEGTTTYTDTALTGAPKYWYRVKAYNAAGESLYSNTGKKSTVLVAEINSELKGVSEAAVSWGDYDNDGDLDLALAGYYPGSGFISKIYRNNNGVFSDINAGLPGAGAGSISWGDYDNDGDLDLALVGQSGGGIYISRIYRNNNGAFADTNAGLPGIYSGSISWGDYDNDGDLDLALAGYSDSGRISRIYRNDNGGFTDINAGLSGVNTASLSWGDYDNDGDLDLVVAGYSNSGYISMIYSNDNGSFVNLNAGLPGVGSGCSVSWGDYDNDGDLDLALAGYSVSGRISRIHRNDTGVFTDANAGLPGVNSAYVSWGDYDNDGDLDLALAGDAGSGRISRIYRNDNGVFTDTNAGLTGVKYASLTWGDYDKDGNLDLALAGEVAFDQGISKIYHNETDAINHAPVIPLNGFNSSSSPGVPPFQTLKLEWNPGSDTETPAGGLQYEVKVATVSIDVNPDWRGPYVLSVVQGGGTGSAPNQAIGNYPHGFVANSQPGVILKGLLPNVTYYWKVRAIDTGLARGEWSPQQTVNITPKISLSSNILIDGVPEVTVTAQTQLTLVQIPVSSGIGAVVVATATLQGLTGVSNVYGLGPENTIIDPPLELVFHYSTNTLAQLGVAVSSSGLYQYNTSSGLLEFIEGQTKNTTEKTITAHLSSLSSIVLLLGRTPDRIAPVTTLNISASSNFADGQGNVFYSSPAVVSLAVADPVLNTITSGAAYTQYRVDGGSFAVYSLPFPVLEGRHMIEYRSADKAGNISGIQTSSITVDATAPLSVFESEGSSQSVSGRLYILGGSTVGISALDAFSGVKEIHYSLDGATAAAASPLVLSTEEGAHTLVFYSIDNLGNTEAVKTVIFVVDAESPVTTTAVSGLSGDNGWYISLATLTLITTDTLSGIEASFYNLGKVVSDSRVLISSGEYTGPLTMSSEGIYAYSYYSTDRIGNIETGKSGSFKIDISSPALIAFSTPTANAYGWNNTAVTAVFSGSDSVSGIAFCTPATQLSLVGSSITTGGYCSDYAGLTSTASLTVNIDTIAPTLQYTQTPSANGYGWNGGSVTLKYTCVDNLSGIRSCPADMLLSGEGLNLSTSVKIFDYADNSRIISIAGINIDKTLPVSSAALAGIYKNGWYSSAVSFTITSTDSLSGVKEALYSLSSAAFATYQQPVSVFADGSYTGRYYSRDKAGNIEAEKSIPFSIDRTAPQVGYTLNPQPNSYGWNKSSVEAVFKGTETLSGMDLCTSSRTYAEGAGKTLVGWCRDIAGNIAYSTAVVNIDISSPIVTVVANPTANSNSWNNTSVTVAFSGSDAISGNFSCTADQAVSSEGMGQIISGSCADYAGNSRSAFRAVNIDKTSPVTTAGLSGTLANSWYGTTVSITLISADALSGVERTNYRLERSGILVSSGVYVAPVVVSADGLYNVYYYGTDKAGNFEVEKSTTFKIDRTLPQVSYTLLPEANSNAWNNTAVQVVFSGTDTLSGVVACSSQAVSSAGQAQTVAGWCRDAAGNIGYSTATVNVDLTVPVVVATQAPAKNSYGWNNTSVTATFAGSDALSGTAYCTPATTMSIEGSSQTITGYCRDYAGLSSTATLTLSIDKTAPLISAVRTPLANIYGWANQDINVNYTCSDNLSGVRTCPPAMLFNSEGLNISTSAMVYDYAGSTSQVTVNGISIDKTKPVTTASLSGSLENGWYNTAVAITLGSIDSLSGVDRTNYRLERAGVLVSSGVYTAPVSVSADGHYAVYYYSTDKAGNAEAEKSAAFKIDRTLPQVSYTLLPAANGSTWNNTAVQVIFNGSDTLSGVVECSSKTISTEGLSQTVTGWCRDTAGNIGYSTATINIDRTPPAIIISSPAAGQVFVATRGKIAVGYNVKDNSDPAPKAAAMLRQVEDRGSSRGARPAAIAVVDGQQIEPLDIDDGIWRLTANATDFADNISSATGGLFEVIHDVLPPRTALAAGAGSYQGLGQALYVTRKTTFTLTSTDDLMAVADGIGLGVKKQGIGVSAVGTGLLRELVFENTNPVQGAAFTSAFKLDQEIDGAYNLVFNSEDVLANVEKIKISTCIVDNTAPQTIFNRVSGPVYLTYVSTWTLFELAPADPGFFASGVKETSYSINLGAVATSPLKFTLPDVDGSYLVKYRSMDNLENLEVERSSQVFVDAAPPFTALNIMGGKQYPGAESGSFYASLDSKFGLIAADPVVGGGASGVKSIENADNGGLYVAYSQPISLAEGKHAITYRAVDRVENTEVIRSTQIHIDDTAPVTLFNISEPLYIKDGVRYVTPVSALTFTAVDTLTKEVSAGVERIETAVDSGQWTKYTQALKFVEGRHTIKYRAIDNVGNVEAERIIEVHSDNTAPISKWSAASGDRTERENKFYLNALGRIAFESADPVINEVASGVEGIYYGIDSVPAEKYASPIGLAEGVRTIKFSAKDNVGNTEVVKSTVIYVDGTKPVTELSISGDQYRSDRQYVSRRTDIVISAVDPVVNDVFVGVKETKYAVNGGSYNDYSLFKLSVEGKRLVSFYSADHVNNVEVAKTAELWVDGTAPLSVFDVLDGKQSPGAEPGSFYASLATKFGFVSVDPLVSGGAAGVKAIEYADNAGTSVIYAQPISLGEGKHSITYRATDRVENIEVFRSTQIYIDNTAPVTSFNIAGPLYLKDGVRHLTPVSELTFTSTDPLISEVSAGVERIETAVDGGQWLKYTQALKFAEGRHTIKYRALDKVGNTEAERVLEVRSDATPPVTAHQIGIPYYVTGAGVNYITPETPLTFSANDPVTSDVASGVERIETAIDGDAYALYTAALKFPEGRHTIKYRAYDNVGNLEAAHTLEVQSDATAPESRWLPASGPWIEKDNKFYMNALGSIALESADPVRNNVAAGLENIYYGIDAAPAVKYTAAFSLAEGVRTVSYSAKDNLKNTELIISTVVYVDGTKPSTELSLFGDQYYGDKQYISRRTNILITTADPVISDVAAGVKETKYSVDGGPFNDYFQFVLSSEGKRVISFYSSDYVSNVEAVKTTELWVDDTSPLSGLDVKGGRQYPGAEPGSFYASSASKVEFTAVDPIIGGGAAGVKVIETADNGGLYVAYSQPISLDEGKHAITYRATDRVENTEVNRSTQIYIDNTAPVTSSNISEPLYIIDGVRYITPVSALTFSATDPLTKEVAAGVERIETAVDGGQWLKYTQALKFAEGRHSIKYRTIDNVGNTEAERILEVRSDNTAPVSTWSPSGDRIERGNKFYLNALGRIAFESTDPVINEVVSGVEGIYYGIDSMPTEKYAVPTGLAEGVRTIRFSAKDNMGNTEVVKSTVIYVDGTKPVSELSITGDQYKSERQYVSRRTDIVIDAADPVANDVSVGVKETKYAVDGAAFSDYSRFKLDAEGRRLVSFYSVDHVNNVEVAKTAELWVDGTAPLSVLDVSGGKQYPGADPGSFYASLATKFGLMAIDPVVSGGAAGVKAIEYADNGGQSAPYTQSISLGEGRHSITYRAMDQVENIEVFQSTQIYIDNTAPVTSFNISEPLYIKNGVRYVTPESALTFIATDPLVSEVSAGVERIETAVDGGQWLKYTQVLKFIEGRHTIKYRGIDNVGNVEAERVVEVQSDATPPVTEHHIGAPYYLSGAAVNYITPDTPLTFSANDPVSSEVASGMERIETAVDGGGYGPFTVALKFPEGRHTIKYRAFDNVGNLETAHTLEVQSDATAPESRWLASSGSWIEKDNKFYLNAAGSIGLESADPVRNNVAAGLENIYYGIDAAPAVEYTAPFSLAEGERTVNYSAKDNLGNTELIKSTVVYVDGTKPVTRLSLSGDQYNGDKQYISQRTDIIITTADPAVNNVAVGVKETKYSVDGAAFTNYFLFKLSAEGKRLVSYYSTDYVANTETVKTAALWVDNTLPSTGLSIAGSRHTTPGDEKLYITSDSGIVLTSLDSVSNDTASGVMLTKYRIDGGNWLVYSGSFTIAAEGLHTLEYYAIDRVQNAEALKSAEIAVDDTPPAAAISLGEPKSEVFGLPVLMQNTPITLTAADPVVNSVSAGINSIFYELENVQTGVRSLVTAYTSPFTITEQGTFIIRYWSKDNLGNTEAPKEKMAAVTTWRGDGLVAASGLDMSGTADISGSVKSNAIVSLGGNARILGDVTASTITLTGKAQITGLQVSGAAPVNHAPIYLAGIVQNAAAVNNNAIVAAYLVDGKLALSSKVNLALSTGTYYFKGMELSGGSSITIAGKVDILVEGGITINGGSSLNAAGEASRLSIIISTASELKFNGGGALSACVYAPYSDLKLTGNALLGGHYFVKTAAVSGTGNLMQSGEALPIAAAPTGGGPKTKAAAMPGSRVGVLAGPDPEFRLGEVYVFPNPAKGTEAPVFHIETGIADSVKITIYTISGRAAHEHTLTALPAELDDGNGLSYAYEYPWRGHIPSGIYLYSIEAQKAGQKLKKTGKFGVVR